jgi:trans-aconitate methyltransferase
MSSDTWSPALYQKHASFVARETDRIVSLLQLDANDVLLDAGCGDGVLSLELQKKCRRLVGLDASANMIAAAIKLGVTNARVANIADPTAAANEDIGQFDKVFSNACTFI